jgi:hypothetical protein
MPYDTVIQALRRQIIRGFAEAARASELRDVLCGNTSGSEKLDDENMKDVVVENAVLLEKAKIRGVARKQRRRRLRSNWLL